MRSQTGRIVFALALIIFGVIALLDSLGVVNMPLEISGPNLIWALLFGAASVAFLITFFSDKNNWWAIIPGLTLLGLAILVGGLFPSSLGAFGAVLFMGLLSLSFWIVYFTHNDNWWAIIPGGVLASITGLILITELVDNDLLGVAVMFLGMGATFLVLYLLPKPIGRAAWPLYPAGVLGIMGFLFLIGAGQAMNWIWGILLVLAGGWIIIRSIRK
ncbi:MAG: hypothetical protein ACXW4Q_16725 [Anaerolineales bacterium]